MVFRLRTCLFLAVAVACVVPPLVDASASPSALLAAILAAGRSERTVHYLSVGHYTDPTTHAVATVSQTTDAGISVGVQRITFQEKGRTGHVTVIANADDAYVRGDAFALVNYMVFRASAAAKYAGVWIAIPRSYSTYPTVAAGVRFASAIDELELKGPVVSVPDTSIDGQQVVGVKGNVGAGQGKVAVTLYGRATAPHLPVKLSTSSGSVTFGGWNNPVHVATPQHSVPIAVVDKTP